MIPSSTVNKLKGYLDNQAVAATNKRDILDLLVANNERLATTKVTTLSDIKALLTNATNSGGWSTARPPPAAAVDSAISEVATLKR